MRPLARTVQEILQSGFFRVPRFQRPFSWEEENLDDFWVDVVQNNPSGYFIGPMVFFSEGPQQYGIVDGQQRLATITLLLCALRENFDLRGRDDLADGVHNFVERPDVAAQLRLVFGSDDPMPYFRGAIQARIPPETEFEPEPEETRLKEAYDFLASRIQDRISELMSDEAVLERTRKRRVTSFLTDLRDRVLGAVVLWVELDNEDDAYIAFETLNSRGMELGVADLLKNHLLTHLRQVNVNVDPYREKWKEVLETFDDSSAFIDVNRFILHWWLSRHDYVARNKLFRAIRNRVGRDDAAEYLNHLASDARYYRLIHETGFGTWTVDDASIRDSLEALITFDVTQPAPLVLSVIRNWKEGRISHRLARTALRTVERFHFGNTAIAGKSSSGGVSRMYAAHARELEAATDRNEAAQTLRELARKLRASYPSEEEFVEAFRQTSFTRDQTRQKDLVFYILSRFHVYHFGGSAGDVSFWTIEHLKSESSSGTVANGAEVVGQIGNLLLVPASLNEKLGTKSYPKKREILLSNVGAGVWVDDHLRHMRRWGNTSIEKRTQALAEHAYRTVWK